MSLIVVPRVGAPFLLDYMLGTSAAPDVSIGLYQNDFTPDADTVFSDLVAATFPGYDEVDLGVAAFLAGLVLEDGASARANDDFYPIAFIHDGSAGSNFIYGAMWFFDGNFVAAERFDDAPVTMDVGSVPLVYFPSMTLRSEFFGP